MDEDYVMLSDNSGLKIKCRQGIGADIRHLAELFVYQEHGTDFSGKTVVDIGMSNGDSAIFFAKRGARKVLGFEPFSSSFNLASENVRINKLESVVFPYNYAVSSSKGQASFVAPALAPHLGKLDNAPHFTEMLQASAVQTISLKEITDIMGEPDIDLLKMDCEGCEHETIQNALESTLNKFKQISMEVHGSYFDIASKLNRSGFDIGMYQKWFETWRLRSCQG